MLEGVFSDETGDFGPGCYVRNPIGSTHRSHSDEGCVIFVKLGQFDPKDIEFVRVNTADAPWQPGLVDGLSVMSLHELLQRAHGPSQVGARHPIHPSHQFGRRRDFRPRRCLRGTSTAAILRVCGCATRRAASIRRSAPRARRST